MSFKCKIRKLLAVHMRAWQVHIPFILVKEKKKKKEKIHKKRTKHHSNKQEWKSGMGHSQNKNLK